MEEHWGNYKKTYFTVPDNVQFQALRKHGNAFAVITACNPEGNLFSSEHNALLNERLRECVAKYEYTPVIGRSRGGAHQEYSFAVAMPEAEAVELGKAFKQLAIFYTEDGEIFLVPCLAQGSTRERIGSWAERLLS